MKVKIVDTTLRDGEQRAGIALGLSDKLRIAKLLDGLGIFQIEAGIPAMGGEEKKSIVKMMELGLSCRISTWNRLHTGDIRHSIDCRPHIIHISAPSSDLQIKSKLDKDRNWVLENVRKCIAYAREKGFEVTLGLEDASRADPDFLSQLAAVAFLEGVERIRYADTVGILHRQRVFNEIQKMQKNLPVQIEIHAHNDLGMAVANSIAAVSAGVEWVNCTIGGLGERAGNCNYLQFVKVLRACLGLYREIDMGKAKEVENEILNIIRVAE